MDESAALAAFSALSQPARLSAFRRLIAAGRSGLAAGEIAEALDVRQNTMSSNLTILVQSGLVRRVRHGRSIRYYAEIDALRGLLAFVVEQCCGGHPEVCQPLLNEITLAS
ncbi:MAG: helix-turn-helix domain-containing protein [Pseudomonadota bacterium]